MLPAAARFGARTGDAEVVDSIVHDGLWDAFNDIHMGVTAENLADQYGIGREEQDRFAAASSPPMRSRPRHAEAPRALARAVVAAGPATRRGSSVAGATASSLSSTVSAPRGEPEVVAVEYEALARVLLVVFTAGPLVALGSAGWLAWGRGLHWQDLLVLAITYPLTGPGVTVGFHRLFTHRSFKTTRTLRALFAGLGSMAVAGPVIEWVSTHRRHHRFSDRPGDPHSPHVDHATGWRGTLRGLG